MRKILLALAFFLLSPAWAGDLGIADMKKRESFSKNLNVFRGQCGGPLSDTLKECKIAFVNGRLVVSSNNKSSSSGASGFEGVKGILPNQVKSISWSEPQFHKHQRFINEIIYVSSKGDWTRAGFQFSHGNEVRGFYSALLRWMSGKNETPDVQ